MFERTFTIGVHAHYVLIQITLLDHCVKKMFDSSLEKLTECSHTIGFTNDLFYVFVLRNVLIYPDPIDLMDLNGPDGLFSKTYQRIYGKILISMLGTLNLL